MQKLRFRGWGLGFLLVFLAGCGGKDEHRLVQLDSSPDGFGMYRSGQPEDPDLEEWCSLGIRKIFALNGEGEAYRAKLQALCPDAEIVYNEAQDPATAVTTAFLQKFDDAVAQAKLDGTKILFHCSCGCHRTGRLAAYYRIKYQNWTVDDALSEMYAIGRSMGGHPYLADQVRSFGDFVSQRPCGQDAKSCVRESDRTN